MASKIILIEVERNVREKLEDYHLDRFFMLVNQIEILDQMPDDKLIAQAKKIIAEKDAVILAEAKKAKCDFLVTPDKKHFLTPKAKEFLKPKKILTPKMLIAIFEK